MDITMFLGLLGGLGIFLYGMNMMGDGLENAAGSKLKFILEKVTSNPVKAVGVGALVTALLQSSSATTVMVVGFVNSGLLNLAQATGVIMGANIGTTVTAYIISLNIYALIPVLTFSGSILYLFAKVKKRRDVASILLGFGLLLLGMKLMGDAMYPLRDSQAFKDIIVAVGYRWYLGVLVGLLITLLVQSSSATTGILVALTNTGSISLTIAFPILLGANIGTCVTALLSSIGANKTARKAALIHLMFNTLGALIFIPLGGWLVNFITGLDPDNVRTQIAYMHIAFNVGNTILLLPFAGLLIKVANTLIVSGEEEGGSVLDKRLLQAPTIAEGQVIRETVRMAEMARDNFKLAMDAFIDNDLTHVDAVFENEQKINALTEEITNFLVELSSSDIDIKEYKRIGDTYHVINDIERIGDHAENIIELVQERSRKNVDISAEATEELKSIYSYTLMAIEAAIESYKNNDRDRALSIMPLEARIDDLQKEYRDSHIRRLNQGLCTGIAGILFLDLISNLERIGDHSKNIADTIADVA